MPKTNNLLTAAANNIGFVFGQNIRERTAGAPESTASSSQSDSNHDSTSSDKLFAAAAANQVSSSSAASPGSANGTSGSQNTTNDPSTVEDLTKVAQAYEEKVGQNKRKYDEVETFTGEEAEINVLNILCKLFAFINSNWEERGPGSLRLNDARQAGGASRIVFRTSGNLRVLLNTPIFANMVAEKSSQKSLRLTAIDSSDGQVKVFLAMARPDDINSLFNAIQKRIATEKERVAAAEPEAAVADESEAEIPSTSVSTDDVAADDEPANKRSRATEDEDGGEAEPASTKQE